MHRSDLAPTFYNLYIDDTASTAATEEEVLALVRNVADQKPDEELR